MTLSMEARRVTLASVEGDDFILVYLDGGFHEDGDEGGVWQDREKVTHGRMERLICENKMGERFHSP